MLHKINLPATSEPVLQCVLDFMERLLELACTYDLASGHDPLRLEDLELEFGSDITSWLTANSPNVLEKLKAFARRPPADRSNTLTHFKNDRAFTAHLSDPAYSFQIHKPAKNDDIKVWLVKFYDQLKSIDGFHPAVCKHHSHFNYRDWWNNFDAANPTQTMCCACDGTMNHGRTIEHYFPKAVYPVLSIHPSNLIPLCDKCNNDKKETDPLNDATFEQIFIPYRDEIDKVVDLEFSVATGGKEIIRLRPIGTDPKLPSRINKYSELFAIPAQWNNNIHEIAPIATRFLKQTVRGIRKSGDVVDQDRLKLIIDEVCDDMEKDWGNAHYFYPASKWLRWAKDNKLESLCAELGVV